MKKLKAEPLLDGVRTIFENEFGVINVLTLTLTLNLTSTPTLTLTLKPHQVEM